MGLLLHEGLDPPLFGRSKGSELAFKILYTFFAVGGSLPTLQTLIDMADAVLFMLAVISIIGLYLLAPIVKRELNNFLDFVRRDAGLETDADEDDDQELVKTAVSPVPNPSASASASSSARSSASSSGPTWPPASPRRNSTSTRPGPTSWVSPSSPASASPRPSSSADFPFPGQAVGDVKAAVLFVSVTAAVLAAVLLRRRNALYPDSTDRAAVHPRQERPPHHSPAPWTPRLKWRCPGRPWQGSRRPNPLHRMATAPPSPTEGTNRQRPGRPPDTATPVAQRNTD